MFTGVFMDKMVGFVKLYFPVFLLGAVFGKVIELSGLLQVDRRGGDRLVGRERAMLSIVLVVRAADLWRRVAVRRGVRGLSVRGRDVPPGRHPQAPDPRHDRARRLHLHHGCAAGHAADPEHHPDDVLQDRHLGGPVLGDDRQRCSFSSVGLAYLGMAPPRRPRRRAKATAGAHATSRSRSRTRSWPIPGSPLCRWWWSAWRTWCSRP